MSPGLPVTPRHCPVAVPDICITGRSLNRAGSQPIQALNMEQAFGEPDTLLYGVTASSPASYQLFPHKQNLLYHCRGSCSTSSSTDHLPLLLTVPGSSDMLYPYRTDFASLLLGVAVKHPDFICIQLGLVGKGAHGCLWTKYLKSFTIPWLVFLGEATATSLAASLLKWR